MKYIIPTDLEKQHVPHKDCNYKTCLYAWFERYIENLEHMMSRMKFDDKELGWG